MPDYKSLYFLMFNAAIDAANLADEAAKILRNRQQYCEAIILAEPEEPMVLHVFSDREADGE